MLTLSIIWTWRGPLSDSVAKPWICMGCIGKFVLSWGPSGASYDWFRWPIQHDIYRLLVTREHPILVWILQYFNMDGFYDSIWSSRNQWTERNYIRSGCTMKFWKLLCSTWVYKNDCHGCIWTFSWNVQKYFPIDLTNTGTWSLKGKPQGN